MKKTLTKVLAVALLVASVPSLTGCYGPFRLSTKLHNWNGQVSNKKFVNELVFLGFCILPAYELCLLGDALIFNSIEFWSGNNPISMKDGEVETQDVMHNGKMYQVIKTKNNMTVAAKDSDEKVNFRYFPEEGQWYQMNGEVKGLAVK
ncbi:MAG: DUF3332 domain-containing protein [Odoribacter sp.]|nr:DUF3332 domain-containing protein [Odoribacter sp.]MDY3033661.1 DUF3332 domain-containing protein [Odoribacter sp.]